MDFQTGLAGAVLGVAMLLAPPVTATVLHLDTTVRNTQGLKFGDFFGFGDIEVELEFDVNSQFGFDAFDSVVGGLTWDNGGPQHYTINGLNRVILSNNAVVDAPPPAGFIYMEFYGTSSVVNGLDVHLMGLMLDVGGPYVVPSGGGGIMAPVTPFVDLFEGAQIASVSAEVQEVGFGNSTSGPIETDLDAYIELGPLDDGGLPTVPLPASFWLLGAGVFGLRLLDRRRPI